MLQINKTTTTTITITNITNITNIIINNVTNNTNNTNTTIVTNAGAAAGRVDMSGGGVVALGEEVESTNPAMPYKWSQTEDCVDVTVSLKTASADGAAGAGAAIAKRDLTVTIKSTQLSIVTKTGRVLLDLALHAPVRPSDSTWSMSGGDVEVSMEKVEEVPWPRLEKE
jgi:hypothetical protein